MNKTIAFISAAVVLGGTGLSAQWVPAASDIAVTSDVTFASEYIFRGVERADYSFQPSVEASAGDFYVGLWANLATANHVPTVKSDLRNEVNYYGGFALEVPNAEFLTLDAGLTVYHNPRASLNRRHEAFVGTKISDIANMNGVSAAVYYFYDFDIRSHVVEGSIGYSFDLSSLNVPASVDVSGLYGTQLGSSIKSNRLGAFGNAENYHYYGASAEVPFAVTENSTVSAGLHYQTAEKIDSSAGATKNIFWTLSYTAGF